MIVSKNNCRIIKNLSNSNVTFAKNISVGTISIPDVEPIDPNIIVFNNTSPIYLTKALNNLQIIINNENLGKPTVLILDPSLNTDLSEILLSMNIRTGSNVIILQNGSNSTVQLNVFGTVNISNQIIDLSESITLPASGPVGASFGMFIETAGIAGMDIAAVFITNDRIPVVIENSEAHLSTEYDGRLVLVDNEASDTFTNCIFDNSFATQSANIELIVNTSSQIVVFTNNTGLPVNLAMNLVITQYGTTDITQVLGTEYPSNTLSLMFPLTVVVNFTSVPNGNSINVTGNAVGENMIIINTDTISLRNYQLTYGIVNYNATPNITKIIIPKLLEKKTTIASIQMVNTFNDNFVLINQSGFDANLITQINNQINTPIKLPNGNVSPIFLGEAIVFKISFPADVMTISAYII